MKKIFPLILILIFLIGCSETSQTGQDSTSTTTVPVSFAQNADDMFTNRDNETDFEDSNSIIIELNGTSAASSSNSVKISGSIVTITDEGTYIISGALTDGSIVINTNEQAKPQLVLNGVDINNNSGAALNIIEADKVIVTLADGTENTLSNGGEFVQNEDENIDGAIFSKQDLSFNGTGRLTVNSPSGHGIVCKDDLVFTGGNYDVICASHGLDANDSVRVSNGTFKIAAGKDGVHCENSDDASLGFVYISGGNFDITAEGDGISAGAHMQLEGGSFNILTGGGSENGEQHSSENWGNMGGGPGGRPNRPQGRATDISSDSSTSIKGLKSGSDMLINAGTYKINSADDALHSNTSLTVNGGTFDIATGDDAMHAEENLLVTNGTITITESYEGLEAHHITVSGGSISLTASDDGLNAAGGVDSSGTEGGRDGMFGGFGMGGGSSDGSVTISGGTLYIKSSGDGIDSNGTLTISGGHTTVTGPTQGDTAVLDYDISGTITGGTFIGTGGSMMAQSFSSSEQGVVALSVGNQASGTQITLTDSSGKTVISHAPELNFAIVIISTPEMIRGETYKITVGSASGEFEAN